MFAHEVFGRSNFRLFALTLLGILRGWLGEQRDCDRS
jgi:hypothetical protein